MGWGTTWMLTVIWLAAGGALLYVGLAGLRRRLPRQRWVGIRLPVTMRSEQAWAAAHLAAGTALVGAGVVAVLAGVLVPLAKGTGVASPGVVSAAAVVPVLVFVGLAGARGVRAAERVGG